ncbi:MAG: alpha/beta hydrolase [Flavobacteriales bacterium]
MINYYLIPGMGADNRLFRHFHLPNGKVHHLDWIPHKGSRSLAEYAQLMAERITTENNVVVGSSMGGMVTVEISKIIRPLGAALVSAPSGRHEFPAILKNLSALKLHKALTPRQVMRISKLADLFMGFKTEDQRAMFYDMLRGNGPEFLHFSVGAVLDWKNTTPPDIPFIQIIGTQDKLFKQEKIPGAIMLEGSGHFTAFEKGKEVSAIIAQWAEQLTSVK